MRLFTVLTALVLCLFLPACGDDGLEGGFLGNDLSNEEAVRQMEETELAYLDRGDYEGAYMLLEPSYRDACSLERYERLSRFAGALGLTIRAHRYSEDATSVEVDGDWATITRVINGPSGEALGEEVQEAVKIDGRWFGAPGEEAVEACGSELAAEDAWLDAAIAAFRLKTAIAAADGDSSEMKALYKESFSERFKETCSFGRLSEGEELELFQAVFGEPFAWTFRMSGGRVSIQYGMTPIADLVVEDGDWKFDTLAGLVEC